MSTAIRVWPRRRDSKREEGRGGMEGA
jgi:hypothetical protein